jgi:hypothetical protein
MSAVQPSYVGLDMVLSFNTGNFATPVWSTVNCRDLKMALSQSEADVSNRGSKLKLTEPGLQSREYTFDMVHDETDTNYTSIRSAFLGRTVAEFAISNGPIGTAGTVASGGTANVVMSRISTKVFSFETDEPLEGAATSSITIKPSKVAQTNAPTDNTLVA